MTYAPTLSALAAVVLFASGCGGSLAADERAARAEASAVPASFGAKRVRVVSAEHVSGKLWRVLVDVGATHACYLVDLRHYAVHLGGTGEPSFDGVAACPR
jgi:hypothetical protein